MDRFATQRIRGFGASVFSEMSRLARVHKAINLGQGFPDFPGPELVKTAARAAIDADANQYAVSHGAPALREAIAREWFARNGQTLNEESEITVTSGATEAIFDAIQAFLGLGDELIVFEPFYDSYVPSATLAGATVRPIRLHPPDWDFDDDELSAAFGSSTRAILLNTPHNPTGKVFSRRELERIAELCQRHDVLAITDEVYDQITYDGVQHRSLATLPGMWERTLTINSTGKSFSMTGWKIGYAIGPASLNLALRAVHQFVTFATATPFQEAMAVALDDARTSGYYDQVRLDYAIRREALSDGLIAAGLKPLPVGGSYFLMTDIAAFGFPDDVGFCTWLIEELGVAAIPPSAFYVDPASAPAYARFCFAKRPETIAAATERLATLPDRLAQRSPAPSNLAG